MLLTNHSFSTYLIRQAMRDYLGSEDMLRPTDRSFLLRLKNARSASRLYFVFVEWMIAADDASFPSGQRCPLGPVILVPRSSLGALFALYSFLFIFCSVFHLVHFSSPPIASQLSPRFEAHQMPELPASKRHVFALCCICVRFVVFYLLFFPFIFKVTRAQTLSRPLVHYA